MRAVETRHLSELRLAEVTRALRALSSTYVERRRGIETGAALSGAGKRAAFALFYGPLHFLLTREIVRVLPDATSGTTRIVDLGCGTGVAGVAWALACSPAASVVGVDRHPWAVREAARTYHEFGVRGRTRLGDIGRMGFEGRGTGILAAFTLNELSGSTRDDLLARLVRRRPSGCRVLIIEPIARASIPWWTDWQREVEDAGGRADEWRLRLTLPPLVASLDRAAGLNHREITGRSLWLP
jgi:hypothetical protein